MKLSEINIDKLNEFVKRVGETYNHCFVSLHGCPYSDNNHCIECVEKELTGKEEQSPVLSMSVQEIRFDYLWRKGIDKYRNLSVIELDHKLKFFYEGEWITRKELAADFEYKKISEIKE